MIPTLEVEAPTGQNLLESLTIDKQKNLRTDAERMYRYLPNANQFYTWLGIAFCEISGNQQEASPAEIGEKLAVELGLGVNHET